MNKKTIIILSVIALLLAASFFWGGNYAKNVQPAPTPTAETIAIEAPTKTPEATNSELPTKTPTPTVVATKTPEPKEKDKYETEPVPTLMPKPQEPQNVEVTDKKLTATLTVKCDEILNNLNLLGSEKQELIPANGVILSERTVSFNEGESVFNLLQRELKRNKIHFEFVKTPMFNSAYIEGINNIYEFDCGELSGWVYSVNGWHPNYGASRYVLKDGDVVIWNYTCDKINEIGGGQRED